MIKRRNGFVISIVASLEVKYDATLQSGLLPDRQRHQMAATVQIILDPVLIEHDKLLVDTQVLTVVDVQMFFDWHAVLLRFHSTLILFWLVPLGKHNNDGLSHFTTRVISV
jgi:hypothetical protein